MGKKSKKSRTAGAKKKNKRPNTGFAQQTKVAGDELVASSGSDDDSNGPVDWDNLEYEDPREDEEVEEIAVLDPAQQAHDKRQGTRQDVSSATGQVVTSRVWLPGSAWAAPTASTTTTGDGGEAEGPGGSGAGEEMTYDPTAYDMLHMLRLEWPCLSFDIVRDALGLQRRRFPHTLFLAAGTQADQAKNNRVLLLKLSELARTGGESDELEGEGALDSDSEEENDPVVAVRAFRHTDGVNRLRCMPQHSDKLLATWADTGKVHVFPVTGQFEELRQQTSASGGGAPSGGVAAAMASAPLVAPLQTLAAHPTEGFALSWSPQRAGRLLTGDCRKHIYLWEPQGGDALTGWSVDVAPYVGHTDSVEDVQWKPDEDNVFASCSMDRTVKVWDARVKRQPALSVVAHDSDVNVLAWNPHVSYLLATGADDGSFRIFDLRSLGDGKPEAQFRWHHDPITSLEWSPDEESVLAVSSDQQATIWDLSLERDAEEEAEAQMGGELPLPDEVPAQLLFVHMGQQFIKELHWHPQIPGAIVSTAADGMNVFRASNL